MAAKNKPNEIYLERIYEAPVKLVWKVWTDPEHVKNWWGPRGFTLTTHSKDFKVGGTWVYTMHGPDGTDYPNITTYHEIIKHSRLVYDHGASKDRPAMFKVTVNFTELENNKTKMEMWMALESAEAAKQTKQFIKTAGGNATWDRLAEYLDHNIHNTESFYINRSFNVSIKKMYDLWIKPEHFSKWLPPTGFKMEFINANIKPGGETFYLMTNDKDITMYGQTKYLEMTKPNQIVYLQNFCDKNGKLSRHPMAPTWPAYMLTTVCFEMEDTNQTRVTVKWEPSGDYTTEEMKTFIKEKGGMTLGWTGSFDKLDDYLDQK